MIQSIQPFQANTIKEMDDLSLVFYEMQFFNQFPFSPYFFQQLNISTHLN